MSSFPLLVTHISTRHSFQYSSESLVNGSLCPLERSERIPLANPVVGEQGPRRKEKESHSPRNLVTLFLWAGWWGAYLKREGIRRRACEREPSRGLCVYPVKSGMSRHLLSPSLFSTAAISGSILWSVREWHEQGGDEGSVCQAKTWERFPLSKVLNGR